MGIVILSLGFPAGTSGKVPTDAAVIRDVDSIPGLGRSLGEGHGIADDFSGLTQVRRTEFV